MKKVKVIDKKSEISILYERELLSRLTHPFIVNMHYSFQDKDNLYLVVDYLSGGDLRYHICIHRRFNEEQTKFMLACLIIGLEYIHKNKIIHRDIKPENLVLDTNGYVHITDFGIAKVYQEENYKETSGTPGYMSPEVITAMNHSYSVDYFALGVIGYEFMLGKRPYNGKGRKEIKEQMISRQAKITPDEGEFFNLSNEAINCINHLLIRKPELRLGYTTINEIKEHEWFKGFNWNRLLHKKQLAPFIPDNVDNYDKKYCESVEQIGVDTQERYNTYIKQNRYHIIFRNFTYYKDESILQENIKRSFIGINNESRHFRKQKQKELNINDDDIEHEEQKITTMPNRQRCQSALNFKTLEIQKNNNNKINSHRNYKEKQPHNIKIEEFIYKSPHKDVFNKYTKQKRGLEKNNSIKNIFSSPNSNNTRSIIKNKEPLFELSNISNIAYFSNNNSNKKHSSHNHHAYFINSNSNNNNYNKWFYRSLSIGNFHVKSKSKSNQKAQHTNEILTSGNVVNSNSNNNNNNNTPKCIKAFEKMNNFQHTPTYAQKTLSSRNKQKIIHTTNIQSTPINKKNSNKKYYHHIRHKSSISRNKDIYNSNSNNNTASKKTKTNEKIIHKKQISEIQLHPNTNTNNNNNNTNNINYNSYSAERNNKTKQITIRPKSSLGKKNPNISKINKDMISKITKPKINIQQREINKYYYSQLFNNLQSSPFHTRKISCGLLQHEQILSARNTNPFVVPGGISYNINNTINTNNNRNKMIKSPVNGVVKKYKKNVSTSHTTVSSSGHVQK